MRADKTYTFLVRCKCPGKLGTARVQVNYTENRDGYEVFTHIQNHMGPETACWGCRRYFKIAPVSGKVGHQKCGSKCQASKGPSCECQCGGKNHGSSYSI